MISITATEFRNHMFEYLDRISHGETIMIIRNSKEVARIVPATPVNWRQHMTITPEVKTTESDLINPMDDLWEDYQ